MFRRDGQHHLYRATLLEALPWLDHGFGTKHSSEWPGSGPCVTLRQVHSSVGHIVASEPADFDPGDALMTQTPGPWLAVRTADCLPVILADPEQRATAVIHAGWRGTVGEIVPRMVDSMSAHFGSRVGDLVAAIGPGIGACCYQVGPEVAVQFRRWFPERSDLDGPSQVDLAETVFRQLAECGLAPERISRGSFCTRCQAEEFHSFRREGEAAGRMLSGVSILA